MNGFRNFALMALVCVGIGLWLVYGPAGCRPPNMGKCEWNADTGQYVCPAPKQPKEN
jgi:hypothetical protein